MTSGPGRPLSNDVRRWVEHSVGPAARILAVSKLTGGLTSDLDRLTVTAVGPERDVVLRRWSTRRWGSGLVTREAAGLEALVGHDLPVPRLLAADPSGRHTGEPCLLMTALPGAPWLSPSDSSGYVAELAVMLARIHAVAPTGLAATDPHPFDEDRVEGWVSDRGLASAVVEAGSDGRTVKAPPVLVHGDYQPFNLLWQDRRLSGVVDWAYVGSGRHEIDVGLCRLALAVMVSAEAADAFLDRYVAESGRRVDPCADLRALFAFDVAWLGFVTEVLGGQGPGDHRRMIEQVEIVARAAVGRLA